MSETYSLVYSFEATRTCIFRHSSNTCIFRHSSNTCIFRHSSNNLVHLRLCQHSQDAA